MSYSLCQYYDVCFLGHDLLHVNELNDDIIVSGFEYHIMATIQTKIKFNVRKKRLNCSKLNNGKENANYGNKISSETTVCGGHGRKFYKNKCPSENGDFMLRRCLLPDGSSDSESDTECPAVKQHENKNGGKKVPMQKSLHIVNTDDNSTGLCIQFYFSL